MFTQIAIRSRFAAVLGLTACLAVAAHAEQPSPVLRTFGFWNLDLSPPNFLGEDSLAVTVLPDVTDPAAGMTLPLLNAQFQQLREWQLHPAHYAAKGGNKPSGSFYWLIDDDTPTPPPVGAHTLTGPEGLIQSVEIVKIRECTSVNCGNSGYAGLWAIDNVNGTRFFVIVKAWFSK